MSSGADNGAVLDVRSGRPNGGAATSFMYEVEFMGLAFKMLKPQKP